jgi:hypothetical protein
MTWQQAAQARPSGLVSIKRSGADEHNRPGAPVGFPQGTDSCRGRLPRPSPLGGRTRQPASAIVELPAGQVGMRLAHSLFVTRCATRCSARTDLQPLLAGVIQPREGHRHHRRSGGRGAWNNNAALAFELAMPVFLKNAPVAYYGSPKVACTSIKVALYEVEHGEPWIDYQDAQGNWHHIHNGSWYPQEPTRYFQVAEPEIYFKFAVVRDPVERFLSAYSNRVLHHGELSVPHLVKDGTQNLKVLPPNPDIATFIEFLCQYRAASVSINYHTELQSFFIGSDLSYYDQVYKLSELGRLAEDLSRICARKVTFERHQHSRRKFSIEDIPSVQKSKLIDFLSRDYDLLWSFYAPPA